jgi:hypothetical protein
MPVLWLYGPPGVGKSTIAWQLFAQLSAAGRRIGYLDLDQVGMCYGPPTEQSWAPEPRSDPGRHHLQSRTLDAMLPGFAAAGADGVVVSGLAHRDRGADAALLPHAALTAIRLRTERPVLRRRLEERGRAGEDVDDSLRYADDLDRLPGDALDTTDLTVSETVRLVQSWCAAWPSDSGDPAAQTVDQRPGSQPPDTSEPGRLLWLCGPTAVGKSTIGWQVYEQAGRAGLHTAFVDLQQIGFLRPPDPADPHGHRLRAGNLAVLWRHVLATGARQLVIVGSLESPDVLSTYLGGRCQTPTYCAAPEHASRCVGVVADRTPLSDSSSALPDTHSGTCSLRPPFDTTLLDALSIGSLTVCRLRAHPDQLSERIALRGQGQGPPIAGDELNGQPSAVLARAVDEATREAERLERAAPGDFCLDTDHRSPSDLAEEILRRAGWLPPAAGQPKTFSAENQVFGSDRTSGKDSDSAIASSTGISSERSG